MKEIKLTKGHVALVDDEDFEKLNQYKWHARITPNSIYVRTNIKIKHPTRRQKSLHMHRLIMNCPEGMMVDHIDRNGLNNQKHNLRICTRSQNLMNSKKPKEGKTSKYKGVNFIKDQRSHNKPWRAEIRLNRKGIVIGTFKTEKEAALAYNKKALELFGEFSRINEVSDE